MFLEEKQHMNDLKRRFGDSVSTDMLTVCDKMPCP